MKRFLSMILIGCMMMLMASAAMAEVTPAPSIEDILNDYHEKAFAAQSTGDNDGATTYSRSAGASQKTLEQETVEELTAAGYEAYNVTAENYDALETSLQTDFEELGLDDDGSYIVVISGDESDNASSTYAIGDNLITPTPDPGVNEGGTVFTHTYGGKTYTMRYVTVTATDNIALGLVSTEELIDEFNVDDALDALDVPISILSSLGLLPVTGTINSLVSTILPDTDTAQFQSMLFQGGTNWTITYTQIYNFQDKVWQLSSSIEYVTMRYFIINTYYDPATNQYESKTSDGTYSTLYSSQYDNKELMKDRAANAYENNSRYFDKISYVKYVVDETEIITHYRWSEHLGYEPQ